MKTALALLAGLLISPAAFATPTTATGATTAATAPGLTGLTLTALDGSAFDASALHGKAVLFVNVASKCGYTKQYAGLQALYEARKADGLVIIGVPSNQFGGQEPGSPEQIATFCSMEYGVTFPLLEKQDVNGSDRSPLYAWLVGSEVGGDADVAWNFEKFLVNAEGEVVGRYKSAVTPDAAELDTAIKAALKS
jgi:glutathione peroxidase